jgi:hypothetical protein
MRMSDDDRRAHPLTAELIRLRMPLVRHKPKVWAALKKYAVKTTSYRAGLAPNWGTEDVLERALSWGFPPTVSIRQLGVTKDGLYINGEFRPWTPDYIYLDVDNVHGLENEPTSDHQWLKIEATILHELVHLVDYNHGSKRVPLFRDDGVPARKHTPDGFEIDAYGQILSVLP